MNVFKYEKKSKKDTSNILILFCILEVSECDVSDSIQNTILRFSICHILLLQISQVQQDFS